MRVFPQHDPYTPVRFVVTFVSDYFSMNVEVNGQNNWTDHFAVEFAAQLIKDEYEFALFDHNILFAEVTNASVLERV
jgi:hypothetical protein